MDIVLCFKIVKSFSHDFVAGYAILMNSWTSGQQFSFFFIDLNTFCKTRLYVINFGSIVVIKYECYLLGVDEEEQL